MARQRAPSSLAQAQADDEIVKAAIGHYPMTTRGSEPPFATQSQEPSMPNAPLAMNVPGSYGYSSTTMYAGMGVDPERTLKLQYLQSLEHGIPDVGTPVMSEADKAQFRAAQANYEAQHLQASGQGGQPEQQDDAQINQAALSPLSDSQDQRTS